MPANDHFQVVSTCYVYKSRLQEYAQKVGFLTPVYETIKEGPSHQPFFRSTVIVNDVRYDSLPGFFNRKAAEQSAAEVALVELAKSNEVNQSTTQPVHETGLCKNLLQEYAQRLSYAMPLYQCKKDETPGRLPLFSCTVEIGGISYIGAAARTKKEAEIKAARTALLAIQTSATHYSEKQFGHSQLTVIPCKKRGTESVANAEKNAKIPKRRKPKFKRKTTRKKFSGGKNKKDHIEANINDEVESHANLNDENGRSAGYPYEKVTLVEEGSLALNSLGDFEDGKITEMHSKENNHTVNIGVSLSNGNTPNMGMDVNTKQLVSMMNDCIAREFEAFEYPMVALEEKIQAEAM